MSITNTVDLIGDEALVARIIERSITDLVDDCTTSLAVYAFGYCTSLTILDFANVKNIAMYTFANSAVLTTLILRSGTVCALEAVTAFKGTPFASNGTGGTVYCPASLITQYQNATNWSTLYAGGTCNFVAIEGSEYE